MRSALLLLVVAVTPLVAQSPTPKLSELQQAKMDNIILRDQMIVREQNDLRAVYEALKSDVEKTTPGYTLTPQGTLVSLTAPPAQHAPSGVSQHSTGPNSPNINGAKNVVITPPVLQHRPTK